MLLLKFRFAVVFEWKEVIIWPKYSFTILIDPTCSTNRTFRHLYDNRKLDIISAWKNYRPTKSFRGMKLNIPTHTCSQRISFLPFIFHIHSSVFFSFTHINSLPQSIFNHLSYTQLTKFNLNISNPEVLSNAIYMIKKNTKHKD